MANTSKNWISKPMSRCAGIAPFDDVQATPSVDSGFQRNAAPSRCDVGTSVPLEPSMNPKCGSSRSRPTQARSTRQGVVQSSPASSEPFDWAP